MKRSLFNLTKLVLWTLAGIAFLTTSVLMYFWYPVDHVSKAEKLEQTFPVLEKKRIEWFSSDFCNLIAYEDTFSISSDSNPEECFVKGEMYDPNSFFSDYDQDLFDEIKKALRAEAHTVGIEYDTGGNVKWARFTSDHLLGPTYYFYIYDPGYELGFSIRGSDLPGTKVPINENWYYVDVY